MNARTLVPPKVCNIIPMLGSPLDGEALGACRAVGRVLDQAGLDFHALAASINTSPTGEADPSPFGFGPVPPYRPIRRKRWAFTPKQTADHRRMALWCRNADGGRLSRREREFVANIASWRRELTIPQADWLSVICDRLEQEDRR